MGNPNKKKAEQLGMPLGTASGKLKKNLLFNFIQILGLDICYRCGEKIESVDGLSIDHKIPWLDNDVDLFWDLDNIAFSHLKCNSGAGRRDKEQISKKLKGNLNGAKLTENEVKEIKTKLKNGATQRELAKKYNVNKIAIHYISTEKTWKKIKAG